MSSRPRGGLIYVKPAEGGPDSAIALVGRISRSDLDHLCERARELLPRAPRIIVCDASALVQPDLVAVEAIARLQLLALRGGRELRLRNACSELKELLDLAGLSDVIATSTD
jgi:ABC-type transporter Mla MlaB component